MLSRVNENSNGKLIDLLCVFVSIVLPHKDKKFYFWTGRPIGAYRVDMSNDMETTNSREHLEIVVISVWQFSKHDKKTLFELNLLLFVSFSRSYCCRSFKFSHRDTVNSFVASLHRSKDNAPKTKKNVRLSPNPLVHSIFDFDSSNSFGHNGIVQLNDWRQLQCSVTSVHERVYFYKSRKRPKSIETFWYSVGATPRQSDILFSIECKCVETPEMLDR